MRSGHVDAAVRLAEDGSPAYRKLNRHDALANLAAYLIAAGRYDDASGWAREAVERGREHRQQFVVAWAVQHLAAIDVLRACEDAERYGRCVRAARLLGFVNARLAALGAPREYTEQQEYARATAVLRAAMEESEMESCLTWGASMDEDRAVDEALSIASAKAD